jgi:septal ring factor EnvC (AmiA/AmiB activator)
MVLSGLLLFVAVQADAVRRKPKGKKPSASSSHAERSSKESELARLRAEIEQYRGQLARHEQEEQRSKKNLTAFNRRTLELEAAISKLEGRLDALEEQKSVVDSSLRKTANSLDKLKSAYASSSRFLYMRGKLTPPNPDLYLFAPAVHSDYARDRYYAQVIGQAHAMNRDRLDSMKRGLGESSRQIARTMTAEEHHMDQEAQEAQAVEARKAEEARQLVQIQHDKERLRKLLQERTASAKRLEGMIANLILKEEAARKAAKAKRHAAAAKKSTGSKRAVPIEDDEPVGRSYGPHSLSWPCSSHKIRQGFGEHRNAELNTVTMNLGVDIATGTGSPILAAAEGEVSLISTLPSYGTIIVLKHSGGLHTVYADLSGVSVRQGMQVRAGQQIGRSGANEENGPVLHFEVWKGKSKQNPMGWLK